jgi:hypothetical protein
MYIFLGGFLDGKAGFTWCTLQVFYEYLILLKVWELKHQPIPSLEGLESSIPLSEKNVEASPASSPLP